MRLYAVLLSGLFFLSTGPWAHANKNAKLLEAVPLVDSEGKRIYDNRIRAKRTLPVQNVKRIRAMSASRLNDIERQADRKRRAKTEKQNKQMVRKQLLDRRRSATRRFAKDVTRKNKQAARTLSRHNNKKPSAGSASVPRKRRLR